MEVRKNRIWQGRMVVCQDSFLERYLIIDRKRACRAGIVSQLMPPCMAFLRSRMEKHLKRRKKLNSRNREIFLKGLKRYQERGIRILVDGREAAGHDLDRLLMEYEDGSFYMGDYIWEEGTCPLCMVQEPRRSYGGKTMQVPEAFCKQLKEIHFDKVYYR